MPRKYNDRIGDICEIRTNYKPTPKGIFHPLPDGLVDGQLVRLLPGWRVMEDRHTAVWSVQPIDANGIDSGIVIENVWERHFRLVTPSEKQTALITQTPNVTSSTSTKSVPRVSSKPASMLPPFSGAKDYLNRLSKLGDLPERNNEDAVKDLLVELGHEREKILFQIGRIDVIVRDNADRTVMVIEVKRSLGSVSQRDDALRKGFDYAGRTGARYVVITDADRFEIYDRTLGLDHASMLCAKFQFTNFSESDNEALDVLRPQRLA